MKYPVTLTRGARIVRDPNLTIRMTRAPAAAAPVAAAAVVTVAPLPYLDAFSGTGLLDDHTANSGHTYMNGGASLIVIGGALRASASGLFATATILPYQSVVADSFIEALLQSDGWATYENNGLTFNLRDNTSVNGYYYAFVRPPSTARGAYYTYTVGKYLDGVTTDFVADAPITSLITENAPVAVRFAIVGDALTLTVAGVDEYTTTDTDITEGGSLGVGLETDAGASAADHIGILTAEGDAL